MSMEAKVSGDYRAVIDNDGSRLTVFSPDGKEAFALSPPEHGTFYLFAEHIEHGPCPVVSFHPDFQINGWQDWYFKLDVRFKTISRLNPWR